MSSALICITLDKKTDDIAYRPLDLSKSSYTFNFTAAEQQKLWSLVKRGTSTNVYFMIRTTINGTHYYSSVLRTLSLVNAVPTMTPIVEDGNEKTGALTGDISKFVKGESEAVYYIGGAAKKGATIVSQKITCGGKENTSAAGSITDVESGTFVFTVTDSRGLTAVQTLEKTLIEYVKPTVNVTASAPTSVQQMKVTISGMCFNKSFGKVNNTINLYYRYAAVDYDYGAWQSISISPSNNAYSATVTLTDIDYQLGYNFEARITDALNDITSAEIHIKTKPIFDWSATEFNFNVPVNMQVGHINYNLYGLCKAMTQTHNFSCSTTSGANYSSTSFSASLVGNCLRCNLVATRSSATAAPQVTNEKICDVTISHGEKIAEMLNVCFGNGSTGGLANFYTTGVSQTADTLSFSVYLASTAQAETSFNTFFIIPVTINLDKFVD